MTGPRMIGIKDTINPYEGLQESVSKVGDIYRNYENDQRNAEKHAREMEVYQRQQDEAKRQENARNYLKDYKVEVGGADFVGLDEDTRTAVIEAERKAFEALGPNATPEQYQALSSDLVARRAKLATAEEVQSRMLNDLVKNGVDPQAAAILSANESSKYQSIDKMQASLAEQAKLDNERADNIAKSIIDYQKALNNEKSNTSVSNGTGVKLGVGESEFDFDTSMMEFLKDRIGSWDAKDAANNIRMAVTEFNARRALEDPPKPPVSAGSFAAVVANAVTSGQLNNEAIYKSPGEWVHAFDEFASRSGVDNAFSRGYRSLPENLQATLNNYLNGGSKSPYPQRSEVVKMRVDEVYKDLLKKKGSGRLDGASGDDTESGRQKETRLQQEAAAFDDYELRELRRLQQEAGITPEGENGTPIPTPAPADQPDLAADRTSSLDLETREKLTKHLEDLAKKPGSRQRSRRMQEIQQTLSRVDREAEKRTLTAKIEADYQEALNNNVGTNVPNIVYENNLPAKLRSYTPEQLSALSTSIMQELENYRAVLAHQERIRDLDRARVTRSRINNLRGAAGYINSRLPK